MIDTLLTVIVCVIAFVASQWWWRSYLNPVSMGVLAWTPAMIIVNWPPFFLAPQYIHLNRPISPLVYLAMALGFGSFWAGCAIVKTLSRPDAFAIVPDRLKLNVDPMRLLIVYLFGLGILIYAYLNSGLLDLSSLDSTEVAESRLKLHLGLLSFLEIFLDIGAIGFFALFMQSGRRIFAIATILALAAYAITLQKSPVVWVLGACVLVCALHPRATYYVFWRTWPRRVAVLFSAVMTIALFIAMNDARGIAKVQMTSASNSTSEQIYIYSGASAIMNMSVTLEGYLPSDEPRMGAYLGRPVLWHFLPRETFESGAYFEGVNAGTYLNYGWNDFRWLGFIITPFLTGVVIMLYLRLGLSGSLFGLIAGAVAARAIIFSTATDIIFDPTVAITLVLALAAHLFVRRHGAKRLSTSPISRVALPRNGQMLGRSTANPGRH